MKTTDHRPFGGTSLLLVRKRDDRRKQRRFQLFDQMRRSLENELRARLPHGTSVWVFGSLTRRGAFNEASDIDIALECEPMASSCYRLSSELEEALGRPVDVVLLDETRLAGQIQRTGERWTL